MLTRPSYNELMKVVKSKYQLVTLAAKRAAQLVENVNLARQGLVPRYRPPQVDFFGKNFLTIAFEEISLGKIQLIRKPPKKEHISTEPAIRESENQEDLEEVNTEEIS